MKQTINFGLIGCGRISSRHGNALQSLHKLGARMVAACDIIPTRVHRFTAEFGGDPYTDYHDMLNRDDIDVVNVCAPSGLHAEIGQAIARAGKHVLVEKPIALKTEDAETLIHTCDEMGVKLGVVLQNRYNPPMQDLRKLVDSGRLGRLLLGNVTVRWFRPQEYYEDGWHGTWNMDGGAMMNQCIHHIDALNWLMGPVKSLFAYTGTLAHTIETEDVGVVVIRFANGALATVEGSTITYPQNLEGSISLFGENGSVKVGGTALNRKVFWKIKDELHLERQMIDTETVEPLTVYGYSHQEQIQEMIEAIREDRQPETHGQEAIKSLKIVLAIYESAQNKREVFFDDK